MDLKARARKLKQDIPTVFLCLKDAETPVSAKILAAVTVGYVRCRRWTLSRILSRCWDIWTMWFCCRL